MTGGVSMLVVASGLLFAVLAQTPARPRPTPTPSPNPAELSARITTLEQENSDLKSKLIECLSAAAAKPKEPSLDERSFQEAMAALRALRAAKQGSLMDFRRYYLDASSKVDAVPSSRPELGALREIIAIYGDAHELFGLGASGRANMLSEERWLAIRSKYPYEVQAGCQGVRVFGKESSVAQTYTKCGLTLCEYGEGKLGSITTPAGH
jgi:hypothetical protein